jgi:hypothetical protein
MAQLIPQGLTRAAITGDDEAIAGWKPRILITPEMLSENNRQALFEGIVTLRRFDNNGNVTSRYEAHCRLSPLFSPLGTRLIGYQIEEGGEPGKIVLPDDVRPIPKAASKS